MKSKLQYAYSIMVFFGVLMTAYLMMNRDGNAHMPLRALQTPTLRTEAIPMDPAVNSLFEVGNQFQEIRKEKNEDQKRTPSQNQLER